VTCEKTTETGKRSISRIFWREKEQFDREKGEKRQNGSGFARIICTAGPVGLSAAATLAKVEARATAETFHPPPCSMSIYDPSARS